MSKQSKDISQYIRVRYITGTLQSYSVLIICSCTSVHHNCTNRCSYIYSCACLKDFLNFIKYLLIFWKFPKFYKKNSGNFLKTFTYSFIFSIKNSILYLIIFDNFYLKIYQIVWKFFNFSKIFLKGAFSWCHQNFGSLTDYVHDYLSDEHFEMMFLLKYNK